MTTEETPPKDVLAQQLLKLIYALPPEKAQPILKALREFTADVAFATKLIRWVIGISAFLAGAAFAKFIEWLAS